MARVKTVASEGMMLTNGQLIGRVVYLGTGDSPDNWWEITEEEARNMMEQEVKKDEDLY